MRFVVIHRREVVRSAVFEAQPEAEAIAKAKEIDETESDWDGWDTSDNDPGEFSCDEVD